MRTPPQQPKVASGKPAPTASQPAQPGPEPAVTITTDEPTFHPFPHLPPELRQQIWHLSLKPRTITASWSSAEARYIPCPSFNHPTYPNLPHQPRQPSFVPPILHVNAEARAVGLKHYSLYVWAEYKPRTRTKWGSWRKGRGERLFYWNEDTDVVKAPRKVLASKSCFGYGWARSTRVSGVRDVGMLLMMCSMRIRLLRGRRGRGGWRGVIIRGFRERDGELGVVVRDLLRRCNVDFGCGCVEDECLMLLNHLKWLAKNGRDMGATFSTTYSASFYQSLITK